MGYGLHPDAFGDEPLDDDFPLGDGTANVGFGILRDAGLTMETPLDERAHLARPHAGVFERVAFRQQRVRALVRLRRRREQACQVAHAELDAVEHLAAEMGLETLPDLARLRVLLRASTPQASRSPVRSASKWDTQNLWK